MQRKTLLTFPLNLDVFVSESGVEISATDIEATKEYQNNVLEQKAENAKKWREYRRVYANNWRYKFYERFIATRRAYAERNRHRIKDYNATYHQAHIEKRHAQCRAYHQAHREEIAARHKAYNEAHREELAAYNKDYSKNYRETHREELREKKRAYYEAHRDEILARQKAKRKEHQEKKAAEKAAQKNIKKEV